MGASSPEELEVMLEDAFLASDSSVLGDLFEEGAMLLTRHGNGPVRGIEEVTVQVAAMWERGHSHVAGAATIFQAQGTALVLGDDTLSVMRRGGDCRWRYAICVFSPHLPRAEAWTSKETRWR
jgi:hypothetical protein